MLTAAALTNLKGVIFALLTSVVVAVGLCLLLLSQPWFSFKIRGRRDNTPEPEVPAPPERDIRPAVGAPAATAAALAHSVPAAQELQVRSQALQGAPAEPASERVSERSAESESSKAAPQHDKTDEPTAAAAPIAAAVAASATGPASDVAQTAGRLQTS